MQERGFFEIWKFARNHPLVQRELWKIEDESMDVSRFVYRGRRKAENGRKLV